MKWTILVLAGLLVLGGCGSTGGVDEDRENRKAAETNTSLGRGYMDRGQYEIAMEKLKRAIGFDPTYAPAHTLLGVLYEAIGEEDLAGKEYRLAIKHDPTDGAVNNNYGAFLCRNGKGGQADPYFQTAVKDPFYPTPGIALANAGSCALGLGDLDKAEEYLRQSLEYDDAAPNTLLDMAEVSYRQSSYLRARAFIQRYEAVGPQTEESLLLGYRIESELGAPESAERYRSELESRFPDALGMGRSAGQEEE